MTTRIHDMPVYEAHSELVDAAVYNLWRRARLHLCMPLHIDLPELKQMALILEEDSWVVVNTSQYDLPVMAWVEFQDNARDALHTPVACTLNYYHYLASHLHDKVLSCMAETLESMLSDAVFTLPETPGDGKH